MSVKKQIPKRCKFHSSYEEIPEQFLAKTDVNNFCTTTLFTFFSSNFEKSLLAKAPTESFAIMLVHFWGLKT